MSNTTAGWFIFLASLGMMCTLLAGDIAHLEKWSDALYPGFIAGVMTHFGAVVAAFVGGKLLPSPMADAVSDARRAALANDQVGV